MDYLIFKALNFNMSGIKAALICYDVMCQWSIHIKDRVNGNRCHGQTTVSDRVQGSWGSGISGKITKMDFEEGSFPKGKSVT